VCRAAGFSNAQPPTPVSSSPSTSVAQQDQPFSATAPSSRTRRRRSAPPGRRRCPGFDLRGGGADARLKSIRARCPEIDAIVRHVAGFVRMIKDLSGDKDTLTGWMAAVDHDLPALRSFTRGLRRDLDAVTAGLTLPYNSGAVEGTVNKIKARKMQLFGRAKLDLLMKLLLLS